MATITNFAVCPTVFYSISSDEDLTEPNSDKLVGQL